MHIRVQNQDHRRKTTQKSPNLKEFHAGQLRQKINVWKSLKAPPTILNVLEGYRIPFIRKPPCVTLTSKKGAKFEVTPSDTMREQIELLKKQKAISLNTFSSGFLSPVFLREKTDGSHRLIFNLKSSNYYVYSPKFRLISLRKIPQIMSRGDYLVKIDISNAYYHVPIAKAHQRYLSLSSEGKIYNMTCLPFGLSSAPSIFSKLTNWVASVLRERDIKGKVYLDDFLLMNESSERLADQAKFTVNFLKELGWHINSIKTDLEPKTHLEYLGLIWDTKENAIILPKQKIKNIKSSIVEIIKERKVVLAES